MKKICSLIYLGSLATILNWKTGFMLGTLVLILVSVAETIGHSK